MSKFAQSSFYAKLECLTLGYDGPENPRAVNVIENAALPTDNGWLTLDPSAAPMLFYFKYLKQTEDRIHFEVHNARKGIWEDTILDVSRNHYLGMYRPEYSGTADYWKVQPMGEWKGGALLDFTLRSEAGRQVGIYNDTYLTLGADTVAVFRATLVG